MDKELKEFFADTRNKLQMNRQVLEVIFSERIPSKRHVKIALENIDHIEKSISLLESAGWSILTDTEFDFKNLGFFYLPVSCYFPS